MRWPCILRLLGLRRHVSVAVRSGWLGIAIAALGRGLLGLRGMLSGMARGDVVTFTSLAVIIVPGSALLGLPAHAALDPRRDCPHKCAPQDRPAR